MGLTVYGGGGKPEEEKTVTAGTSVIEVNPSSGKVMKKVTVNPTPTESKRVTPTTSELTVTPSAGKHLSQVVVGAVEDVTPEVTAQTPIITQIAENLGVTITTPSGTNKQILQGNNANLLNIKNNAKKEGLYVWKKLTADGGDFIDFVVSDSETAYPDGGEHGGYWYEKVTSESGIVDFLKAFGFTKVAIDKFTYATTTPVKGLSLNHSLGALPGLAFILGKADEINTGYGAMYISSGNSVMRYGDGITIRTEYYGFYRYYADTVQIHGKNSANFAAGIEYSLFTACY